MPKKRENEANHFSMILETQESTIKDNIHDT